MERAHKELRCFCTRQPLLAVYGVNDKGKLYVHVRVYKQRRVYGEVLVTEGKVQLHCRECLRWHTVNIVQPGKAVLQEDSQPLDIDDGPSSSSMIAPRAPAS